MTATHRATMEPHGLVNLISYLTPQNEQQKRKDLQVQAAQIMHLQLQLQ